jgi:hypothetical protein
MEMETSRFILGLLFLVVGIALFVFAIVIKLQMEREVRDGKTFLQNNFFPYWNSDDFSEKGNKLRKTYNIVYFVLIAYSLGLMVFMRAGV